MALFTPSESPAVVVREIDLAGGVPNVQSTTGALVGKFNWGPVLQRVNISNETELVETFSTPFEGATTDFLSASQFLRYSSSLQMVRNIVDGDLSAFSMQGAAGVGAPADSNGTYLIPNPLVLNSNDFDQRESTLSATVDSDGSGNLGTAGYEFIAKYPGLLGNSISVSYCPADTTKAAFNAWAYNSLFDKAPTTTTYADQLGSSNDEIHLVVIDEDGLISGSKGSVLETYPSLSVMKNARADDGRTNYVCDVVSALSKYVYMIKLDLQIIGAGGGTNQFDATDFQVATPQARTYSLESGISSASELGTAEVIEAFDYFADKDQTEVDFLIAPSMADRASHTTVVNDLVAKATSRKDCVVVASPARDDIIGVTSDADKVTNTIATADTFTNSSYLVLDNNFLKVYDKYNDAYEFIPAASTVAGIMAATDFNRAAWFSPAGSRRGQLLGITSLAYSPTKAQRDALYKADVNPIANIPGQGSILFGDKTALGKPSAFDRINVRRLFIILERAIGRAAEQVLFEFNDEFTRAEFVNIVEPVLREVQGRRGITDFRVVCDETNNTAEIIDRNEFKADIFIKPARSINYVTLNFVAVRSGVDFEEVVGTV